MIRQGFVLIEVLLVTLISAILGGILFSTLSQTQRVARGIESRVHNYTTAFIMLNQMEKDFMGSCIPQSTVHALHEKDKDQAPAQPTPGPAKPSAPAPVPQEEKEQKVPPAKHIFYATTKEKNLALISCITNNPLQIYWSEQSGSARPRFTRVTYKLEPEKTSTTQKPSYQLIRYEHAASDDPTKKIPENAPNLYIIASGIKSCTITFFEKTASDEKDQKKKELTAHTQWDSDARLERYKKQKSTPPAQPQEPDQKQAPGQTTQPKSEQKEQLPLPLPTMITIDITLWDQSKKSSVSMQRNIIIPIDQRAVLTPPKKDLLGDILAAAFGQPTADQQQPPQDSGPQTPATPTNTVPQPAAPAGLPLTRKSPGAHGPGQPNTPVHANNNRIQNQHLSFGNKTQVTVTIPHPFLPVTRGIGQ